MADILSQEEIDALLDVVEDDECDNLLENSYNNHRQITLYDFKRPNRVRKEQLRTIRMVHDRTSRDLSNKLSQILEDIVEIQLHSVDQMTYGEYLMSLPNPTSFNIFDIRPLDGQFALEVNPSIIYPIIDRLLGGSGEPYEAVRELSNIENKLFEKITNTILLSISHGWNTVFEIAPFLRETYNTANHVMITSNNEIVIMVVFEIIVGYSSGMVNVAYPVNNILPILDYLSEKDVKGIRWVNQKKSVRE